MLLLDKVLFTVALAGEVDTTMVQGMAGAGVANPYDGNAIRRSPASMQLVVDYTGQSDFYGSLAEGPLVGGLVSVKDTRTSDFGAGLQTRRQWSNIPPRAHELPGWKQPGTEFSDKRWEQDWRLGVGYGFGKQALLTPDGSQEVRRFAVGAGAVYTRTTSELSGSLNDWEFNAGLAARPLAPLTVAASAHGLGPWGHEPLWYEAGAFVDYTRWQFAADGIYRPTEDTPMGWRAGAGVQIESLLLRTGAAYDRGQWLVAGGLGVASEGVRADYGVQFDLASGHVTHSVGFFGQF